jgi:nitrile hydratase
MTDLFQFDKDREASSAAKVRALEALLIEKGVLGSDSVDAVLQHFETMAGPFNGAKIDSSRIHQRRLPNWIYLSA